MTQQVTVEGYDKPLPLYTVTMDDGSTRTLAEVRRIGLVAQMIDPEAPEEIIKVDISKRQPLRDNRLRHLELHRAVHPLRLPALSLELGVRDDDGDADHADHQLDGGVRAEQIPVPRPRT